MSVEMCADDSKSSLVSLAPIWGPTNPWSGTNVQRMTGAPYAKTTLCDHVNKAKLFSPYLSTASIMGISKDLHRGDPNYRGSTTTDPTYYPLWVLGAVACVTTSSGTAVLKFTHYVRYWGRNSPV